MKKKKTASKYLAMLSQVKEELGPKCVACEDGYTAKPNEIIGVYVYSKRQTNSEWSGSSLDGLITTSPGFTTVTHNNYIHFTCHQEAARVDREKQQPIREWDGAKTRNHMTLCNNLCPVRGGDLTDHAFQNVVDRFFTV